MAGEYLLQQRGAGPRQADDKDRIRRGAADALARGGRAVLGGADAVQPPYVAPTVLVDVDDDMEVLREETFGPVVSVYPFRSVDEAIASANDSRYGLNASIWTTDTSFRDGQQSMPPAASVCWSSKPSTSDESSPTERSRSTLR